MSLPDTSSTINYIQIESIYWNIYCSKHTMSMQSIEDDESLSQRFTYQEKVTGLLILTVTCTYPRSAVSFIFLTPLGDTFASKELILPAMYIISTEKKKIYPKQHVKKAGIHFTKWVYKLNTSECEFLTDLLSASPVFQSRNAHLHSFVLKGVC